MTARSTDQSWPVSTRAALSVLAPAAAGLLPALALGFGWVEKDEAYEWTQHRLAGLGFAVAFLLVFLLGRWRANRVTVSAGTLTLGVLVALVALNGLAGFHPLLLAAGGLVAGGYWFARRTDVGWGETVLVGLGAGLSFWAASRLSWWQPFFTTLESWPSRLAFLGCIGGLVWLLREMTRGATTAGSRWISRGIDLLVLLGLAAAVLRTNAMSGYGAFPHHWSVYTAPADLVRAGGQLLSNVPSQYGFLSILVLALLPTDDRFTALFWVNSVLVWSSGAILYFTLRAWLSRWWWQLGAGLVTIGCVAFFNGYPADLTGPLPYPSVGAMRFIWVHALLGYLAWWHRRAVTTPGSLRPVLWTGSFLWLLGVLWSVESAVYATAAWFPAATLLAMQPAVEPLPWVSRLRALFAGMGRALVVPGLLLAITLGGLVAWYRLRSGHSPAWPAYWEYATAFSGGFGSLFIESQGAVWMLLLVHTALLAVLVNLETDRQRTSLALIWAAWGALWAASTYYIARSHDNNLTNLAPVLLLVVGLLVQTWKIGDPRSLAAPWVWVTVPSFLGALLWLVVGNPEALKQQWQHYAVEPHVARLRPAAPPGLTELIARCQQMHPGPYSLFDQYSTQATTPAGHIEWLPLRSGPLLGPLSADRQYYYLDAHRDRTASGWLLAPVDQDRGEYHWLTRYIDDQFIVQMQFRHEGWQAIYYVPRPDGPLPDPLPLDVSGLPGNIIFGRDVRMMLPPAAVGWPLQGDERELVLESGYDPTAYLEGQSNGTQFVVELTTPTGLTLPVHERLLDPAHRPGDRAILVDRFPLPPFPPGSRLTVRTTPGPQNDNAWDWAYLASASVVRAGGYTVAQFPGFSRAPDTVATDIAYYAPEGAQTMLALHAPASLGLRLRGGERSIAFDFGFREGAYRDGGNTDGARFRVIVRRAGQADTVVFERMLKPVTEPADRGLQHAAVELPASAPADADLVLSIDAGPSGNAAWDWTGVANLRIK